MRKITPAPEHEVKLSRPDGEIVVRLKSPPLGHHAMVGRYFTPPVFYANGDATRPIDDKPAVAEYAVLMGFVLLADVLTGEDKPATARPAPNAERPAWDAYGRTLRAEFEAAGYCEGDIAALLRGYNEVSVGRGKDLGKTGAPSPGTEGA
ncbi:MAG: hypothetical protein ACEQSX_15525 [Baekduiaceae bacterium]